MTLKCPTFKVLFWYNFFFIMYMFCLMAVLSGVGLYSISMLCNHVFIFTLKDDADIVDKLVPDCKESREPCRRRLFSLPYPDSACWNIFQLKLNITFCDFIIYKREKFGDKKLGQWTVAGRWFLLVPRFPLPIKLTATI
jgi:hypothetical protein